MEAYISFLYVSIYMLTHLTYFVLDSYYYRNKYDTVMSMRIKVLSI